jgi:DNA-binding transcriptional LysR family regulator
MDLNRAAILVRVVEEGGFSAAARALGLPKSSVSRSVALLEEELGVRLLQRSTRKMHLTEAGSAFYERASRGIAGVQEAAAAAADLHHAVKGSIRITAPVDAGVWLLEPLISRFVKKHPEVQFDVVLTGRVVDMVDEGFDLALRAGPLRDGSLIARKLNAGGTALYASPKYLARKGTPKAVAELAQHDCVVFRPSRGRATWKLHGPQGVESIDVAGVVGADDFSFIRGALLSGTGVGMLPGFLCPGEGPTRLVRVLPEHAFATGPLHLVYPSARYLPHRVTVFRDALLRALGAK